MNFAWLGDAPETLPLGRAIARTREHRLLSTALAPNCQNELAGDLRGLHACRSWEELVADTSIDVVVVSSDDAPVLQAARQLAAEGRSLVVFPALGQSETFLHELALLEAEAAVNLVPVFPLRFHPLVERLRTYLQEGALGRIRHVQLERAVAPRSDGRLLQHRELDIAFLFDADLLRSVCGDYNQVTALRIGSVTEGFSLANATLAGKSVPTATWSMSANASPGVARWALTVTAESGKISLSGNPDRMEFALQVDATSQTAPAETVAADVGPLILDSIVTALSGGPAETGSAVRDTAPAAPTRVAPTADWTDVTRSLELMYAVEQSLRRRRTIDVYFEAPSERSTFKTKMTATGCSLLMFTLLAVVLYLGFAATVPLNATLKKFMVGLIFLPLGLFLALQLLYFITKPGTKT